MAPPSTKFLILPAGAVEWAYAEMAQAAGIDLPETRLFPAKRGPGFFGVRRFDRIGGRRLHMHTVSGLLNIHHAEPAVGYADLLKLARALTRTQAAVDRFFLRMAFNVLAHNRDDHTKNHAFVMDEAGVWAPSPADDLTFSDGPHGEHALDVGGNGRDPGRDDLLRVRGAAERWNEFAAAAGVDREMAACIGRVLAETAR